MEENLKAKYGSHRNSEAEFNYPLAPSVPGAKYGSTYGNDESLLGPVVSNKLVSEYDNGSTNSIPTTTVSKKGIIANLLITGSSFSNFVSRISFCSRRGRQNIPFQC